MGVGQAHGRVRLRVIVFYLWLGMPGLHRETAVGAEPARPPVKAQADDADPQAQAARRKLDRAFKTCFAKLEEGSNLRKLKMEVFFHRRKGAPVQPYLETLEKELADAGADSVRGMHIRSVLAFGYAMASKDTQGKGFVLHLSLLEKTDWPPGSDKLRIEVIRDFLLFMSVDETRDCYRQKATLLMPLLRWYIAVDNPSDTLLPFGRAARRTSYDDTCHNVVRRRRMKLKGHFLPLKKAGYFCGEIGEMADCERLFKWALKICPSDGERVAILDKLSGFMAKAKQHEKALAYFRQAHPDSQDPQTQLHLASLFLNAGRKAEAEAIVARVAGKQPDRTTLYRVGRYYVRTKQHEAAIQCLERYPFAFDGDAASYNESVRAAYNLASAYHQVERLADERKIIERVVAHPPRGEGFESLWHRVCQGRLELLRARERARAAKGSRP